jgi:hypothetical protein
MRWWHAFTHSRVLLVVAVSAACLTSAGVTGGGGGGGSGEEGCDFRRVNVMADGGAEAARAVVGDEPVVLYNLPPQRESLVTRLSREALAVSTAPVWVGTGADFNSGWNSPDTRTNMTLVRTCTCLPSLWPRASPLFHTLPTNHSLHSIACMAYTR